MIRMFRPALVVMAALAVLAPAFGAETSGAKGIAGEPDIADIAKRVFPSVVRVEVQNHIRRVATGVVVEKGGYVVTTALMSPRDEKITVTTSDGQDRRGRVPGLRHGDPDRPAQGQGRRPCRRSPSAARPISPRAPGSPSSGSRPSGPRP